MQMREGELQAIAAALTRALQKDGLVRFTAEERIIQRRIIDLIVKAQEAADKLEAEATRMAEVHAGKLPGIDFRKIVHGILERLARERDFPL